MYIVLLNAPPRAGKDAVAQELFTRRKSIYRSYSFARVLKNIAHAIAGLEGVSHSHFENSKDTATNELPTKKNGLPYTPRELYIDVSENMIKPHFGKDFFGRRAIAKIKQVLQQGQILLVTDAGFVEEAKTLLQTEIPMIQIQIRRDGCSFANDSRSYWQHPDVPCFEVNNDGTVKELADKIETIINKEFKLWH
jgi:hypothetical protein